MMQPFAHIHALCSDSLRRSRPTNEIDETPARMASSARDLSFWRVPDILPPQVIGLRLQHVDGIAIAHLGPDERQHRVDAAQRILVSGRVVEIGRGELDAV
jgi:hypothetical protein